MNLDSELIPEATRRPGAALPRLVATDLDGTLLRSDGTVSDRTCAALAACTAAGVEVLLVTARPQRMVLELARRIGCTATAICANGAAVLDVVTGLTRLVHSFTVEQALSIIADLRAVLPPGTGFALETGGEVFSEPTFRPGLASAHNRTVTADLAAARPAGGRYVKVLARDDAAAADAMLAAARAVLGDRAEASHSGGRGLVEIAPPGVTKAGTLAWHCELLGIAAAQVVAFGDMPNDLPMLTWAGTAYAVANAHADVLAVVDRVTASNDEDGVAAALEALLAAGGPQSA
ncbi:HAD hydrolase family protein [Actinocrinis puniceicyclus]|uniref:HAD hydrolase family protein n=1 Tax=Actinocrinis puniceicyclus TaxID=977794 RepID=A0A8J7WP65_9ACTN|nr:HAD family hydrolase [Actinocrinis puniceicyclus]MBS2963732.1 HAD hydrolase family protein [Actinocrinis puniceicyclus]